MVRKANWEKLVLGCDSRRLVERQDEFQELGLIVLKIVPMISVR
jgi:hypothetical protein